MMPRRAARAYHDAHGEDRRARGRPDSGRRAALGGGVRTPRRRGRDHRVLGRQLDLFSINEMVGPGLVLWHPKGAMIRYLIESFWREEHLRRGYEFVYTPHVGRIQLIVDKSQTRRAEKAFAEALIANPDIADVVPLTDKSVYVIGRRIGTTRLICKIETDQGITGWGETISLIAAVPAVFAERCGGGSWSSPQWELGYPWVTVADTVRSRAPSFSHFGPRAPALRL